MPRRQRVEKARTDALTSQQRMDLRLNGPLGARRDDGRYQRLWADEDHREGAYWSHRAEFVESFLAGDRGPANCTIFYDDDPEVIAAVIEYFLARSRDHAGSRWCPPRWSTMPVVRTDWPEVIRLLEELEGVPGDSVRARRIYRTAGR